MWNLSLKKEKEDNYGDTVIILRGTKREERGNILKREIENY